MPSTDYLLSDRAIAKAKRVVEAAMSYRCDVERPISGGTDEYGQPAPPVWGPSLFGQKCLLISMGLGGAGAGEQQNNNTSFVVDRYLLYLPYGTDMALTDRITAIFNRDGSVFDNTAINYEIKDRQPNEAAIVYTIQAIH